MNYQKITKHDIANGEGIRVVLWVSGCTHHCNGCHNKQTWDCNSGAPFDLETKKELFEALNKPYISGITFSGGDPLHTFNRFEIRKLSKEIRTLFPEKTQWLYTGYTWDEIVLEKELYKTILDIDVLVDGRFEEDKKNISLPWCGSENQRVIDVKKTFESLEPVLLGE